MARRRNRAAQRQRSEDSANRVSNAPMRRFRQPRMRMNGGVSTVSGSELLGNVNTMGGAVIQSVDLDPATMSSTWLMRHASCFNKYKYLSARLRYSPFCPTNINGRIIMAWNSDANQTVGASSLLVSQFANAVEAPLWREVACNFNMPRTPEFIYNSTGTELGDVYSPGVFLVYTDYGTGTTNVACGSLFLDYTIQFWDRSAYTGN